MYCLSKVCHVCLTERNNLQIITNKNPTFNTLLSKLEWCMFSKQWTKTRSNILICMHCYCNVHVTSEFVQMCHKNSRLLHGYLSVLNNSSDRSGNIEGSIDIRLTDISKTYASRQEESVDSEHISSVETTKVNSDWQTNVEKNVNIREEDNLHTNNNSTGNVEYNCSDYKIDNEEHSLTNIKQDSSEDAYVEIKNELLIDVDDTIGPGDDNSIFTAAAPRNNKHNVSHLRERSVSKSESDRIIVSTNGHSIELGDPVVEHETYPFSGIVDKSKHKRHMLVHNKKKNYECTVCGKRFSRKPNLKQHMFVHTGEGNFKCSVCNKQFLYKLRFEQHLVIHTGEKRHKCSLCDRRFNNISNLKRHCFLLHSGVKNYECSVCYKTFNSKSNSQRHFLTHNRQ